MASTSELLPAPVGPVIANRSRSEKSISTGSRYEVRPWMWSLSGFMRDLVVKALEEGQQGLRWLRDVCVPVERQEQLGGAELHQAGVRALFLRLRRLQVHGDGIRQQLAHHVAQAGRRPVGANKNAQVRVAGRFCPRPAL